MKTIRSSPGEKKILKLAGVCIGLTILGFSAFNTALEHDFIDYDDPGYISKNPYILQGFTRETLLWTFQATLLGNWAPLTWWSHMLDLELYGLNPAGHHLTSLLIHLLSILLLFGWLYSVTGKLWSAAATAAFFGIHPLRVESVVWIAERKDVLSACFGILCLWTYCRYAQKKSVLFYGLTFCFLLLGLLSKAMLVTWPFVFLLMDVWPLDRLQKGGKSSRAALPPIDGRQKSIGFLLWEKIPFFLLAFLFCVIAYYTQQSGHAVIEFERFPLYFRILNMPVSYLLYLKKIFFPANLALLYPLHGEQNGWILLASFGALAGITLLSVYHFRKKPWLLIGWLWFLGTLVPVIGLVQIGRQSIADRYSYLPSIGIIIAVVWTCAEWAQHNKMRKIAFSTLAVFSLLLLLFASWIQTYYWKDSLTIFKHTIDVTRDNPTMELNYAVSLRNAGEYNQAAKQIRHVLQLHPGHTEALATLGVLYLHKNEHDKAVFYLKQAMETCTGDPTDVLRSLALAYADKQDYENAESIFKQILTQHPEDSGCLNNLAAIAKKKGNIEKAMELWNRVLLQDQYSVFALRNLAWIMATSPDASRRNPKQALEYALRAYQADGDRPTEVLDALAAAYAATGDFQAAVQMQQRAIDRARKNPLDTRVPELQQRLALYKNQQPYIDQSE